MKKIFLTTISILMTFYCQSQNIYCSADFSYTQNGTTVTFSDQSVVVPANPWGNYHSLSWAWDFGDGNISNLQSPTHTYSSNGAYIACLILTFFDSTVMNSCTSVHCDSIIVGNTPPATWDCGPTGCYDPGNGLGQYTTLAACQANCGSPISTWDCGPAGCYDPGTGQGQYTTLGACQSNCNSTISNFCDSMIVSGTSQYAFQAQVNNINTIIEYWSTSLFNGTIIAEDSMTNTHYCQYGTPLDTVNVCITYADPAGYYTCCETWVWDAVSGSWAKLGNVTLIEDIKLSDKILLKIVDALGRETEFKTNTILFYIYNDGSVEKKIKY